VTVTHFPSGARWQTITRSDGRYSLEHLAVGGPYGLIVRAIGFEPARSEALFMSLGQRQVVDLTVIPLAVRLEAVVVRSKDIRRGGTGADGPALAISESTITRLPIRGRDVFQLALLSPRAVRTRGGGLSLAGQPDRLVGLQIDGATNNDLLGNSTIGLVGTPGQGLGARTLSPEAVQELQIITAPFDVRFGNFAAGLVNAVTRSGSNRFEGSMGAWYSGGSLVGRDAAGERGAEFNTGELGVTLAGPIVRDRAAFFFDAGIQRTVLPQDVPLIGTDSTLGRDSARVGIRRESVNRLQEILSQQYSVDPGTAAPFPLTGTPLNFFAKITLELGVNSHLELSQNYSHNTPDVLTFIPAFSCRQRGFFCLTSSSFRLPVTVQATRLGWTSIPSPGIENELRLARLREHNRCLPATPYPSLFVRADLGFLLAGSAAFCTGSFTTENIFEATDNLTLTQGAHRVTVGGHAERIRLPTVDGLQYLFHTNWIFDSLDSLATGTPSQYESTYRNPARGDGPLSDLGVTQPGVYLQDQWNATARLTLTVGIRVDVPFLDRHPTRNAALRSALGVDNSVTPSGNTLWSPRLGWSLDISRYGRAVLRGGLGVFAGRPPFKWFDQVYVHTGLEALTLACFGSSIPPFTLDPAHQPTTCGEPAGALVPFINVFDPAFRFPRNLKMALGFDRQLPGGIFGTVDLLLSRGLDDYDLRDINLLRAGAAAGEGGRVMYGTMDAATGIATPSRRSQTFGPVLEVRNDRGDRASALTLQLGKRFTGGSELGLSYSHIESRDRFSATEDASDANFGSVPLDGTLDDRRLATSAWSVPHKVGATGLFQLPDGFHFAVFYTSNSGAPYTYVIRGDANADGFGDAFDGRDLFNDAVYVPTSPADITLADANEYSKLARFVDGEPCLRESRGRILQRNACRNPWVKMLNVRLSKTFGLKPPRSMEVITDVFNLLALLGSRLGEIRETVGGGAVPLLELTGYDHGTGRGVYRLIPVERSAVANEVSRWRVQLGARFSF
jgi:hypothetical protein